MGLRACQQGCGIDGATLAGQNPLAAIGGDIGVEFLALLRSPNVVEQSCAVAVADLAHGRLHPLVDCRDIGDMGAAIAGAPDADAGGIDLDECLEIGDRVADILDLLMCHDAPFGALAAAEAAIIEAEHDITRIGEVPGVVGQDQAADATVAVAKHDAGALFTRLQIVGKIEIPEQLCAFAVEMDVALLHRCSPNRGFCCCLSARPSRHR